MNEMLKQGCACKEGGTSVESQRMKVKKRVKRSRMHRLAVEAGILLVSVLVVLCRLYPRQSPALELVAVEVETKSVSAELFQSDPEKPLTPITDLASLDLSKVGSYEVEFLYKRRPCSSTLLVVDTTPPTATPVPLQVYNDETPSPEDFVDEIKDASAVTVSFAQQPDFTKVGEQPVSVLLTDASGNKTTLTQTITVIADTTPPEFSKLPAIKIQPGGSVSYRKDVTVTDDRDGELTFEIDSSNVEYEKEGEYKVIYTAQDKSGNVTVKERKVIVKKELVIDRALVDKLAKEKLAKIVTDKMTPQQKVKAVFDWVRKTMTYASSPETELCQAAYVAFTKSRGDCTNYYAITSVLLDNCGIQNMKVERVNSKSSHVWLLVNVGTGWYHLDTSPQSIKDPFRCFMKTDKEVWAYAKSRSDGRSDYYNFDTSAYPKRATKKYSG